MLRWDEIDRHHGCLPDLAWVRPEHLDDAVDALCQAHPDIGRAELGQSFELRPIQRLTLGTGPSRVLLWSQMHGDEPTHTEVLIRLLYFLGEGAEPWAREVLSKCQLVVVPMLNPDGAAKGARYNAQGIDINRDARQLQTPEGRILHNLVETWRPDLALTLHNQNRRTAVKTGGPAATVSLLAPPASPELVDTPAMIAAKQLAVVFSEAVSSHCRDSISRYDADYMPRCFGEWIQSLGTSTLLVEAGGMEIVDLQRLSSIHLLGLIATLWAHADDSYQSKSVTAYEAIPRSPNHKLFDYLMTDVTLDGNDCHGPCRVDLGINQHQKTSADQPVGRVDDIGDLQMLGGLQVFDGDGLRLQPGVVHIDPALRPAQLDQLDWASLLREGITTIVGMADGTTRGNATLGDAFPINVAFVSRDEDSAGKLGNYAWFADRRELRRDGIADLVCWSARSGGVSLVMVNGHVVWQDGHMQCQEAGRLLAIGEGSGA